MGKDVFADTALGVIMGMNGPLGIMDVETSSRRINTRQDNHVVLTDLVKQPCLI